MPHRSALLLVDFQRDFLADNGRMPISRSQVEPLIIQTNRAISAARAQGVHIVAVANEFSPDDRLMNVLRRNAAIAGSEGAAWDERVTVHDAPYFTKTRGDAFSNERLRDHLATLGIEEVVLAGLMAKAPRFRAFELSAPNRPLSASNSMRKPCRCTVPARYSAHTASALSARHRSRLPAVGR
jgi:nicotinamidase-related amidase